MPPAPDDTTRQAGEIWIDASQLRPGVHVRLPLPWIEHQFMFSSFVIADAEQARLIAAMKLAQLFCDPARCKVLPLPRQATAVPVDSESVAESERLAALAAARVAEKLDYLLPRRRINWSYMAEQK